MNKQTDIHEIYLEGYNTLAQIQQKHEPKMGVIVNFHIAIGKTIEVVIGIRDKELPKVDIKTPFDLHIFSREPQTK